MSFPTSSEFALIDRYFKRASPSAVFGVGDDAAIVAPTPGMQLLMSTDMLVAGTHFLADTEPEALGWKTLAVNVSDIAAMGAMPRWALLALSLPTVDEAWIAAFARGFFACAAAYGVELIGGDTTRGPMNFCVTILGEAPAGQALLRSGACMGDDVWVSGRPGRAALGLAHLQQRCVLADVQQREECLDALHRPQPRVALGLALRGLATAAIDVSDGLFADIGHLCEQSQLTAEIRLDDLPPLAIDGVDATLLRNAVIAGGDDYELAFTAPSAARARITALAPALALPLTRIGAMVAPTEQKCRLLDAQGTPVSVQRTGYDHFA